MPLGLRAAAQAAVMITLKAGGSLLPLGLILLAILGMVAALPAQLGAWVRRWVEGRPRGET